MRSSFLAALLVVSTATLASAQQAVAPAPAAKAATITAYRAVVADGTTGAVQVVDLQDGKIAANFTVASAARVHVGATARYVYLVQNESNRVNAVDSGIDLHGHGDHTDIAVRAPRLLPAQLEGAKPVHFNRGGGRIAVFFDGDGSAQILRERDFVQNKLGGLRRLQSGGAHHGVAKPFDAVVALSRPSKVADQTLPDKIEVLDANGRVVAQGACTRLHGEVALGGDLTAFGCADALRIFERQGTRIATRQLAYPAQLPAGRMVRNMKAAAGMRLILADFGADGLVVVDPTGAGEFQFVQLPARRMSFELQADPGNRGYAMLEDGRLLLIDTVNGRIAGETQATARYAMESGVLRPRLAAIGPYVVVTDPATGEISIRDATSLAELRRVKLGGAPFDIVAVGGTGSKH